MMNPTEEALVSQIKDAFGHVQPPMAEDMLDPRYGFNLDADELKMAFLGKHWTELSILDVFRHRESVFLLSPVGYRAYLPAYLTYSLTSEERYGPDIRGYMVDGLMVRPGSDAVHVITTRDRLAILDEKQRAAVVSVLRYLADVWTTEAADVLRQWEEASSSPQT